MMDLAARHLQVDRDATSGTAHQSGPTAAHRSRPKAGGLLALLIPATGIALGCNLINSPQAPGTGELSLPPGFELRTVVTNAAFPVPLVFLPDGTLLYGEKNTGQVRVVTPEGELLAAPLVDVAVASLAEQGLPGLALEPGFADGGYVYFSYAANGTGADNVGLRTALRIARVRIASRGAVAGTLETIATVPADEGPGHEGGVLAFGADGHLYVSIGDRAVNNFPNDDAQDPNELAGRILRYAPDGAIPADNPFGAGNPTYAYGVRNVFGMALDPLGGRLFASDNGASGEDELLLLEPGANYGWPVAEGLADTDAEAAFARATPGYVDPLLLLGRAPTGMAFQHADVYGAEYVNALLVAEYVAGDIRAITLNATRDDVADTTLFASGIPGGINALAIAPDGIVHVSTENAIYAIVPE